MPAGSDDKRFAKRIDADGHTQVGPNWDSLIERQIREAMQTGKFDELPHQGKPLPNDENPHATDMALAFHILKNAGVAPPWVEADKEARDLLSKRDAILERVASGAPPSAFARKRDREALTEIVNRANSAITRVNAESPTHRQHRRFLVLEEELAGYEAACRR